MHLLLINIVKSYVGIVSSAEVSAFAGIVPRCMFNFSRSDILAIVPVHVEHPIGEDGRTVKLLMP